MQYPFVAQEQPGQIGNKSEYNLLTLESQMVQTKTGLQERDNLISVHNNSVTHRRYESTKVLAHAFGMVLCLKPESEIL
jgi:hypothetical protein